MLNTKQNQNSEKICSNPGCEETGIYPAPKSRENLNEYLYLCISCIKVFNKSWNYFAGLSEKELEIEIRKSVTWDRPSWKFGTKNLNHDFEEAFRAFNGQKKLIKEKVVDKKLESCFKVLGLSSNSKLREVKSRYKILAKKWHPDVQNDKNSKNKDTFINITNAYKNILKSFTKTTKNK